MLEARAQGGAQLGQVARVRGGVLEHPGRQGALRPIGLLMRFRQLHAGIFLEQGREADRGFAHQLRRDPRVEQVLGMEAVIAVENAQIVVGVVEDLLDLRIGQQRTDGAEVRDGERVDDGRLRAGRELDQIDAVAIAMEARRFGVRRDQRRAAEPGDHIRERRGGLDEMVGRRGHSFLATWSRPAASSSSALASVL